MIEADVDVPRVRPGRVQKGVGLQVVFVSRRSFGSHATHRTSVLKRASADLWPSRYKGDEVVATMRRNEKELIAEAVKRRLRRG